ncbi:MAG: IS110 family transposase [Acidobacteriales bacterium]|nr:IS110 family transposase [Candidatus Koribacter versatilis]MBI3647048.1 IS110 family transposase [Terriglobales bacterium]
MMIIGCDFHPSWQQVSWLDTETGETGEQKLVHASGDAKKFYQQLAAPVRIGMEATGNSQWFIELVEDLGHEIWIGDAAQIRASYVRQQKTDKRDAAHILKLVVEGRFPRLWTPDREQRDLRQLVLHRHKLVRIRSRVKNELQHLSLNKGMQRKHKLWSQAGQKLLRELPLKPWAACRREDLLGLLATLDQQIGKLDQAVRLAADQHPQAKLLMTQPGVGPNTALAFVLTLGDARRFPRGKQVASYLGLIPREYSSGGRQMLGSISKQGNRLVRSLLVEAAQIAVRHDPGLRKQYLHRCHRKPKGVAKVAAARKLAVRLYWMLRTQQPYPEIVRIESSPRVPLVARHGE